MIYFYYQCENSQNKERRRDMRAVGIVCEYNPFHNGHKTQIDALRAQGFDCIVGVMSGNYTQRGESAIADKYTRAKTAIKGGADLIFELPFPYSSFSAEGFALSGVHIIGSLGIKNLSFGSESVDISLLKDAAEAVTSEGFSKVYSDIMRSGNIGSTAAYFKALASITGKDISPLSNDILAISYICAIKKLVLEMDIVPIKRQGAAYNENLLDPSSLPSATAIRKAITERDLDLSKEMREYIPMEALEMLSGAKKSALMPPSMQKFGDSVLSFFKLLSPEDISARAIRRSGGGTCIAEDGCGICERLCRYAKTASTFEELIQLSCTAKYTRARINRVALFSVLGVSDCMTHSLPPYTVLLAASQIGREFLSSARKLEGIQIVTKPADAPEDAPLKQISELADSLYATCMPCDASFDYFTKIHPYISG